MVRWRVVLIALLAAACAGQPGAEAPDGLRIVATTSIWGDVAANVAGPDATVEVLLPRAADPHEYQASAAQIASLRSADLLVINGLGLEEGLDDVIEAAAADGVPVLALAELVDPQPFATEGLDAEVAGRLDPHVWLDPVRVAQATRLLGDRLAGLDPSGDWTERAAAYADRMLALDEELAATLEIVPDGSRKLVTNHDSLGYFADRYGFTIIGTVLPGGGTLADPSSSDLAALVDTIARERVPAIFAETIEPTALSEAVAAESGSTVAVVELYTGSLGGPDSGAETLIDLLRTTARLIAEALT